MLNYVYLLAALVASVVAQEITLTGTNVQSSGLSADYPTGSSITYATNDVPSTLPTTGSYVTLTGITTGVRSSVAVENITVTTNGSTYVTASPTQTFLVGGTFTLTASNTTANRTGTRTSSSATPTNTQPCNGWAEFCTRKYSNVTMVTAHNSPFSIQGNIASNQALDVTTQLNDGIRMLQFQVHQPNGTGGQLYMCHTSCDLLNAGLLVNYLTTVREWMDANPYEVVTILMGNYEFLEPGNFTSAIIDSGIRRYAYTPPTIPMPLDSWPTLGEMIIKQERAVLMLDYQANQDEIPWLLDEFSNLWETPFSPTDSAFPCTAQRPPDKSEDVYSNRMYMANHNLNVEISFAGLNLLIPGFTLLNQTNGISGYGSAGATVDNCTAMWDRPPNFILVDYYNIGSFNGSIFQAAATANNVTYDRNSCCGTVQRGEGIRLMGSASFVTIAAIVCAFLLM